MRIYFRSKVRTLIYLQSDLVNQNYFGSSIIIQIKNLLDLQVNGRHIQQDWLTNQILQKSSMWIS